MSNISNNTERLQTILESLKDKAAGGGGIILPTLGNEGSAPDLMEGKELIDSQGKVVTGTFTIDNELAAQDNLIAQIQTALQGKSGGNVEITLQNKTIVPSAVKQIVTADNGYDGLNQVTVEGDDNLISKNIMSGISIFGVEGTASGGGGITVSVLNNLSYPIIVNGRACEVGVTTSNIPYDDGLIDFFIMLFDEEGSAVHSLIDYTLDSASAFPVGHPHFGVYGNFVDEYGTSSDNCYPICGVTSAYGMNNYNISGMLGTPPWDYVNDTPLNGATIEFIL